MFIKIIKGSRESVFECIRYSLWEMGEVKEPTVMLEIRGEYDLDMELTKRNHELYILNNDGKTIDTYRW